MRLIFLLFVAILLSNNIFGQQQNLEKYCKTDYSITSDSLLSLFSKENILTNISKIWFNNVDPKDCYHNDSLKKVLTSLLLDRNMLLECRAENIVQSFFNNQDSVFQIKFLTDYLREQSKSYLLDTILKTSVLYSAYMDTVYDIELKKTIQELNLYKWQIPSDLLDLLVHIKWPEVYTFIRQQWIDNGKQFGTRDYYYLLMMQDPELIDLNNNYIDSIGRLNSDSLLLKDVFHREDNAFLFGSYYYDVIIKHLSIKTLTFHPYYYDESSKIPYNTLMMVSLSPLTSLLKNGKIQTMADELFVMDKNDANYKTKFTQASEYIYTHIDVFVQAIKPLKDCIILSELYWKQNMPYYKKE